MRRQEKGGAAKGNWLFLGSEGERKDAFQNTLSRGGGVTAKSETKKKRTKKNLNGGKKAALNRQGERSVG